MSSPFGGQPSWMPAGLWVRSERESRPQNCPLCQPILFQSEVRVNPHAGSSRNELERRIAFNIRGITLYQLVRLWVQDVPRTANCCPHASAEPGIHSPGYF